MMSWLDNIPINLKNKVIQTEQKISYKLRQVEENSMYNQKRILDLFRKEHVSEEDLVGSTGYGYDDTSREKLEKIYSGYFKTKDAIVKPQIMSGTHAITIALFGNLYSGDTLYYATGMPYDTVQEVIGISGNNYGSLIDHGINFKYSPLNENGEINFNRIRSDLLDKSIKIVAIQRSRGYSTHNSFTVSQIKSIIKYIRKYRSDLIIFVDNCYGEFTEIEEPTFYGADLMAGSLYKNPGAGFAKSGGYLVGSSKLISNSVSRLIFPGATKNEGATYGYMRDFYKGFFMAPHVTAESMKGMIFTSCLMESLGLNVSPKWDDSRSDIVQSITFNNQHQMIDFCVAIQHYSPINSFVDPIPSNMDGYEDKVIMASGSFVEGSTIELSADGPIRSPYNLYIQGGLSYEHVKIAIVNAIKDTFYK